MLVQQLALAVIVGLAAARISRLLGFDTIFDQQRHRFFRLFPPNEDYARHVFLKPAKGTKGKGTWQIHQSPQRPLSKIGQLVICPWCSSVYFCAVIVGYLAWHGSVPEPVLIWGASCSVAGLCGKMAA